MCGALMPGDLLPTTLTLQRQYGVSAGTASRAVSLLRAEGVVASGRRSRPLVASSPPGEILKENGQLGQT